MKQLISAVWVVLGVGSVAFAAECPVGYEVAAADDAGESLVTHKTNTANVKASLESTFPDLAGMFGTHPKINSSYQDAKDANKGGATFSTDWKGHPIRGIVSCTIDGTNSTVAVIFARTDAAKGDWDKLMNPAAVLSAQPPTSQPAGPPIDPLGPDASVYNFPDGSGSITLAKGWTTQADSAIHPIFIKGPDDDSIGINVRWSIYTAQSPLIQMRKRNEAMLARMGRTPPPAAPMLTAEFTDPVQAMTDLTPQFSQMSETHGGFTVKLDEITTHQDIDPPMPGAKAAIIRNKVTRTQNGKSSDYVNAVRIYMAQAGPGQWTYTTTGINAPADRFDQLKASMFAMIASEQINPSVTQQRISAEGQAGMDAIKAQGQMLQKQLDDNHAAWQKGQDQRIADGKAAHDAQEAGYAAHNQQWQQDETQKQRNCADFIETIKGTRTLYDTKTGESAAVDLSSINGVCDSLNQATLDPNRFVQIPLRDEMYPVTH